ncbi:hypothetical protein [Microbulbifer sp. ALW1]|uniref:hypothetical protein n=1 Tax=Microbulbifer sp. (strain ALW1) TaxID=1516059 RepID=UPI00135CB757|nr:hypothetical protein [Microbulbifer sp. ALW1]
MNSILAMTRFGKDGVMQQRPRDLINILDNLNAIADQAAELDRRIDRNRVVAARCHSFGDLPRKSGRRDAAVPGVTGVCRGGRFQAVVGLQPARADVRDGWTNRAAEHDVPQLDDYRHLGRRSRFFPRLALACDELRARCGAERKGSHANNTGQHFGVNIVCTSLAFIVTFQQEL